LLLKIFVSILLLAGVYFRWNKYVVNAFWTWITWDNNGFITWYFWQNSPSDFDIITALYGDGRLRSNVNADTTAYTKTWYYDEENDFSYDRTCETWNMSVVYLTWWTSKIPLSLSSNTIYVLNSWNYITTWTINMSGCSAIIGSWTVTLQSDGQLDSMILNSLHYYTIIDNININWEEYAGGIHAKNNKWIYFSWEWDVTINNVKSYANVYWIILSNTVIALMNNIKTHNNSYYGVYMIWECYSNTFNNLQIYNNDSGWIYLNSSNLHSNTINNSQIYNNGMFGIKLSSSKGNVINGSQIYNNGGDWIDFSASSSGNILIDSQIYNNSGYGLVINSSSAINNKYYWTLKLFANGISNLAVTIGTDGYLTWGDSSITLWTTWNISTTWSISWDYITNVINKDSYYLSNRWSWSSQIWNNNVNWSGFVPLDIKYSYGINVLKQTQPAYYNSYVDSYGDPQIVLWFLWTNDYDTNKFIWSNISQASALSGNPSTYINYTGNLVFTSSVDINYILAGDFISKTWTTNWTKFTGSFSSDWAKTWIIQFRTGDDRATHYQVNFIIDIIYPVFTWTTAGWTVIVSWWRYSGTGVKILFSDTGLSWATFNYDDLWWSYSWWNYINWNRFSDDGVYIIIVTDLAWNSTWITFFIDNTYPAFVWTTVGWTVIVSWWYYSSTGIKILFSDTNLSWATLNGWIWTWWDYTSWTWITWDGIYTFVVTDLAWNSTWITWGIDIINPEISSVISPITWYYTTWTISLLRSWSVDTGSGISWYVYQISTWDVFANFIGTWTTNLTWAIIRWLTDNSYYRRVSAFDKANNTWIWSTWNFIIDTTYSVFTWLNAGWAVIVSWWYYSSTGIKILFSDTNLSWATLNGWIWTWWDYTSWAWITWDGIYTFVVTDLAGNATWMTFFIDMTSPSTTFIYPTDGLTITWNYNVTFIRSWSDNYIISGYNFYLYSGWLLYYTSSQITWTSLNLYLINWTFSGYVIITDKAWNTGISATNVFILSVPFSATVSITWTNILYSGTQAWTKDYVSLILTSNKASLYTITWDTTSITWTTNSSWVTTNLYLTTWTNGIKYVYITLSTGLDSVSYSLTFYIDTTPPSAPTLDYPTSWWTITTGYTFVWDISTDAWVGLSGYRYWISTSSSFTTINKSWRTTMTGFSITNNELGLSWTFYRYVQAKDKFGWTGNSAIQSFIYSGTADIVPDSFTFSSISKAKLNRVYKSATWTITWLSQWVSILASVDKWAFFINGVMTWSSWYVQNGSTINIELVSSDEYDDLVTSTLNVWGLNIRFRVTTMTEDEEADSEDTLSSLSASNSRKFYVLATFNELKALYENDTSMMNVFMNELKNLVADDIDELEAKLDEDDSYSSRSVDEKKLLTLNYLYELIDNFVSDDDAGTLDDGFNSSNKYVAPNGKVYILSYSKTYLNYTSLNFVKPKYFATLQTLKAHIDANNWWTDKSAMYKGYIVGSSYTRPTWNHTVDTTRTSIAYTAPNGKVYDLFKTTDGRYSSYDFAFAKYFNTLDEIKSHISRGNPRR